MPVVARPAIAGRPDRGRRRDARDGARLAGPRRPRRPLRPAGLQRRARPLPDLGARPAGGAARGHGVAWTRRSRASADAVGTLEPGRWLRGRGWRSGDWSPAVEPTRQALDEVTGDTPAALMARDYHSLWLNSAALGAWRTASSRSPGGVVERDERGEPTGRAARGVGLAVPRPVPRAPPTTSSSTRCATG